MTRKGWLLADVEIAVVEVIKINIMIAVTGTVAVSVRKRLTTPSPVSLLLVFKCLGTCFHTVSMHPLKYSMLHMYTKSASHVAALTPPFLLFFSGHISYGRQPLHDSQSRRCPGVGRP